MKHNGLRSWKRKRFKRVASKDGSTDDTDDRCWNHWVSCWDSLPETIDFYLQIYVGVSLYSKISYCKFPINQHLGKTWRWWSTITNKASNDVQQPLLYAEGLSLPCYLDLIHVCPCILQCRMEAWSKIRQGKYDSELLVISMAARMTSVILWIKSISSWSRGLPCRSMTCTRPPKWACGPPPARMVVVAIVDSTETCDKSVQRWWRWQVPWNVSVCANNRQKHAKAVKTHEDLRVLKTYDVLPVRPNINSTCWNMLKPFQRRSYLT